MRSILLCGIIVCFYIIKHIKNFLQEYGLIRNQDYFVDFGSVGQFWFISRSTLKQPLSLEELRDYGPNHLNLIEVIGSLKGVERIFYLDESSDVIHGIYQDLHGTIEWRDGQTRIAGDDIFRYGENDLTSQLLNNEFHNSDAWLKHTYQSKLPILPDQLARLFHNKIRPDLIACTDLETVYHKIYSHDSYIQKVMNVPLVFSGKGIVPKMLECARVVDVLPTILSLLDRSIPSNLVGKNLLDDS